MLAFSELEPTVQRDAGGGLRWQAASTRT